MGNYVRCCTYRLAIRICLAIVWGVKFTQILTRESIHIGFFFWCSVQFLQTVECCDGFSSYNCINTKSSLFRCRNTTADYLSRLGLNGSADA